MGFIVGVDIGSSYIRAVFAEDRGIRKKLFVHAVTETKIEDSDLIEEGTIINFAMISELIFETLTELVQKLPETINGEAVGIKDININVSGDNIELIRKAHTMHLKGVGTISKIEIEKLFEDFVAVNFKNLVNKTILHIIPTGYQVDGGRTRFRKPDGQHGSSVSVEAETVLLQSNYLNSLLLEIKKRSALMKNKVLEDKLNVDKIVFTPFAVAAAALSDTALDEGVAIIDIGAETTNVSIFRNRGFVAQKQIMIGGKTFVSDIAEGLGVKKSDALKMLYADVNMNLKEISAHDVFVVGKEKNRKKYSILNTSIILKARFIELFSMLAAEVKVATSNKNISQVVLCGGLCNIEGLPELVEEVMDVADVEIADVSDFIESNVDEAHNINFTTAIGLVLWDSRSIDEKKNVNYEPIPVSNPVIVNGPAVSANERMPEESKKKGGFFGSLGKIFNNETKDDVLD